MLSKMEKLLFWKFVVLHVSDVTIPGVLHACIDGSRGFGYDEIYRRNIW